jgi:hypothetical protein
VGKLAVFAKTALGYAGGPEAKAHADTYDQKIYWIEEKHNFNCRSLWMFSEIRFA